MVGSIELSIYVDAAEAGDVEQAIENHPDIETVSEFGRTAIMQYAEEYQ